MLTKISVITAWLFSADKTATSQESDTEQRVSISVSHGTSTRTETWFHISSLLTLVSQMSTQRISWREWATCSTRDAQNSRKTHKELESSTRWLAMSSLNYKPPSMERVDLEVPTSTSKTAIQRQQEFRRHLTKSLAKCVQIWRKCSKMKLNSMQWRIGAAQFDQLPKRSRWAVLAWRRSLDNADTEHTWSFSRWWPVSYS